MLLASKGGLSSGGVGICKIGRGGALLVKGSVTPGIKGINGGRERDKAGTAKRIATNIWAVDEDMLQNRRK